MRFLTLSRTLDTEEVHQQTQASLLTLYVLVTEFTPAPPKIEVNIFIIKYLLVKISFDGFRPSRRLHWSTTYYKSHVTKYN